MSLTTGRGPLSATPLGRFNRPVPSGLTYVEPFPRRVRALRDGRAVVDSERVLLVHRPGQPPVYAFPAHDVGDVAQAPVAEAPGYVTVPWADGGQWLEEEDEVFFHPRNPYHRVDIVRTRRRLLVEVAGAVLVDTDDTLGLYETALHPRLYVSRDHVRMELLEPSPTTTYCPYKGTASYWSARVEGSTVPDVAWSYDDPLAESTAIARMLSFDGTRAQVVAQLPGTEEGFDVTTERP